MPYTLKGRNVLVTGGSRGLGALLVQKFAAEGSNVAINFVSSKDRAVELAENVQKDHGVKAITLQGDVGIQADCYGLIEQTIKELVGLDIIISNAADWDKCWAVNCKANLHLMQKALPIFNDNADGGVFLVTSSVAGIGATGSSMPYSVTKAAGLQLVKCLASTQGPKTRVNAVLPGFLRTEWGARLDPKMVQTSIDGSFLKREVDLEDCADMFIAAARNYSLTGQFLQIDAGSMMLGRKP